MNVSMIYLAAGNSRRFGSNKLLCMVEGKPMYRHLLDRLIRIAERQKDWELLVVTQYPEIMEELAPLQQQKRLRLIGSPDSALGISHSIRAGLTEAGESDACAFFVADQPYLSEETAERFLRQMEERACELGCVSAGGHLGNPTWFSRRFFPELMALSGDTGGKKVMRRYPGLICRYPAAQARELKDLDYPV